MSPFEKDLAAFCSLLNKNKVEYLIVGGLAVNYHGFQRATGDIDIWYNPTEENYGYLMSAIQEFGYETSDIAKQKHYKVKGAICLQLDRFTIELLSIIDGKFTFKSAYEKRAGYTLLDQQAPVLSYEYLIQNNLHPRPKGSFSHMPALT